MSVYIPGMKMPKSCWWCACSNKEFSFCQADKQERHLPHTSSIPDWCPIIPVPEHGRLIEAERLKEVFHRNVVSGDAFDQLIDIAPTIIPADFAEDTNVPAKTKKKEDFR